MTAFASTARHHSTGTGQLPNAVAIRVQGFDRPSCRREFFGTAAEIADRLEALAAEIRETE